MSDLKKVIVAEVQFSSEEGIQIFILFGDAYNDCDLDEEGRRELLKQANEFKEGIKRLIKKLVPSGSKSLKS